MSYSKDMDRPYTVVVEGNIGSGKSTFLNHFQENPSISVLSEPVELWRNCGGTNLFALLYEDPKRWSFTFQSYVLLTMIRQHSLQTNTSIKVMERSIYSVRYCFVDNMQSEGIMPSLSVEVLDEYFNWVKNKPEAKVDLVIYLRTSPDVVYERMLQRNRDEEKTVSLEYLTKLHDVHEKWLYYKSAYSCPAPILIVDANLDKTSIVDEYIKSESVIMNKLSISS
ncbi:deoxynucleoside kinase-like [Onthophagus taurus]|uniref:deoxynucleoside kinase-like n=1 Tax=Onthophagus taurus TaxID=166361 RepID=UPI000C1FDB46|nr:deoxynucleoside kinase-like [Onthophagus taurus]